LQPLSQGSWQVLAQLARQIHIIASEIARRYKPLKPLNE